MSPTTSSKSRTKTEPFSLVPFAVQRRLYELVHRASALRERLNMKDRIHTDFAEIGAISALTDSDPIFPAGYSIGARVARTNDLAEIETELAKLPHTLAEVPAHDVDTLIRSVVEHILPDPKRFAVVPTTQLVEGGAWKNALRFAGRHRLPILFIVPGTVGVKRASSADLRTLYAEFGIPVMAVEANDPIAAYRVATEAAHNARVGRGATILEAVSVETAHANLNSQPPLQHLEDYMRRKGSWDEAWRAEVEVTTRQLLNVPEEQSA